MWQIVVCQNVYCVSTFHEKQCCQIAGFSVNPFLKDNNGKGHEKKKKGANTNTQIYFPTSMSVTFLKLRILVSERPVQKKKIMKHWAGKHRNTHDKKETTATSTLFSNEMPSYDTFIIK